MNDQELLQLYATARDNFLAYCILTDPNYDINWHLKSIAHTLENAEKSLNSQQQKQLFIIIETPPRHGKSEECSIKFPGWFIGKNPDKHIITASYSGDLSLDFGTKARNLVKSKEHQCVFPGSALMPDSQAKERWLTTKGGSYTSVGVGGTVTGRGAHVLLIDDPHKDRAEADSLHMRDKIFEWFRSTAYSRLEPRGIVILIMQRWHKDDLAGRIINEYSNRDDIEIIRLRFPAIATKDEEHRRMGEALWPARYDVNALYRIRDVQGIVNWSSQYMQEPILQENQEFKQEYFKYFEEDDIKDKEFVYTTTVDLASGKKESENEDYVSIITVGREPNSHNWYIVDCCIERLDPLQVADKLFSLYSKYRMIRVGIESNGYQKTFKFWLDEEQKKRGVFMPLYEIHTTQNKEAKIRGLIGYYQTGVIYHRKSYMLLESQLLNFPQDKHDDGPDALAMQLEIMLTPASGINTVEHVMREHVDRSLNDIQKSQRPFQPGQHNTIIDRYKNIITNIGPNTP